MVGGEPYPALHLHPEAELRLQALKVEPSGGFWEWGLLGVGWGGLKHLPPLTHFPRKSHSRLSSNRSQGPGIVEPTAGLGAQQLPNRCLLNRVQVWRGSRTQALG